MHIYRMTGAMLYRLVLGTVGSFLAGTLAWELAGSLRIGVAFIVVGSICLFLTLAVGTRRTQS